MSATNLDSKATVETFGTTSPVTGSAPTDLEDGTALTGKSALALVITCPASQTLSGAGAMQCYTLDPLVGMWARSPGGDFTIATSGSRALAFDPVDVPVGRNGRIKWVPSGVTFTGGSTGLDAYILGQAADGAHTP
jgi:hypothetical protein